MLDMKRMTALNVALFLAIAGTSTAILLAQREVPGELDIESIRVTFGGESQAAPAGGSSEARYPALGRKGIFDTIIQKPTPTPTPVPTPKPDPRLEEAIAEWRVDGVTKSLVFLSDKSKTEWEMTIGESKTIKFRGSDVVIILKSVNPKKGEATFSYTGPLEGEQQLMKSMFDDEEE